MPHLTNLLVELLVFLGRLAGPVGAAGLRREQGFLKGAEALVHLAREKGERRARGQRGGDAPGRAREGRSRPDRKCRPDRAT